MTERDQGVSEDAPSDDAAMPSRAPERVLVVATEEISGDRPAELVRERLSSAKEVWIVFPAVPESRIERVMGDVDGAMVEAAEHLEHSIKKLGPADVELRRSVGDADPLLAIQDALLQFPADEILLVTRDDEEARAGEEQIFEHAKRRFDPPIVHIALGTNDGSSSQRVADVESAGAGKEPSDEVEFDPRSDNMARFSARDVAGMVVAAIGSLILIVLAANCDGGETIQRTGPSGGEGSDGGCVARYLIAGVTVLANLAHIVGLLFFESIGYRGRGQRAFAWISLIGTPLAIVLALLVA